MATRTIACAVLALAALCAPAVAPQAQEDVQALDAIAFWHASGQVSPSGEHSATFVGTLSGELYVDTGNGPVHAGQTQCPGLFEIDLRSGRETGSGSCAFVTDDGAMAYGEWECHGVALVGCRGTFTLTGGTGRLQGIAGESGFLLRGELEQVAQQPGAVTEGKLFGIAVWSGLQVTQAPAEAN